MVRWEMRTVSRPSRVWMAVWMSSWCWSRLLRSSWWVSTRVAPRTVRSFLMVSSFSGLRATRYSWAWFLAKCLAVSWAMEEVAPIIIIFMIFMVASYQFLILKRFHFYFVYWPPAAASYI